MSPTDQTLLEFFHDFAWRPEEFVIYDDGHRTPARSSSAIGADAPPQSMCKEFSL